MEKKKTLKCKFKDEWNGYPIHELAIDDIWRSVPMVTHLGQRPFRENLINDIRRDGMYFPIMCVHTSHAALTKAKEKWGPKIEELPFWHNELNPHKKFQWSVWGGSQRLEVARYLGFTHIDAAELPNIGKAISLQKVMRQPFLKRYYE